MTGILNVNRSCFVTLQLVWLPSPCVGYQEHGLEKKRNKHEARHLFGRSFYFAFVLPADIQSRREPIICEPIASFF